MLEKEVKLYQFQDAVYNIVQRELNEYTIWRKRPSFKQLKPI